jgi:hypothetical protein
MEHLSELKEKLINTSWQWVAEFNKAKPMSICKIQDVVFKGGMYFIITDDGNKLNTEHMNDFLTAYNGQSQLFEMGDKPKTDRLEVPNNVQQEHRTDQQQFAKETKKHNIIADLVDKSYLNVTKSKFAITMNLPDMKMVKQMYKNSSDKKAFMDDLSSYIISVIKEEVIIESLMSIIDKPSIILDKKIPTTDAIEIYNP